MDGFYDVAILGGGPASGKSSLHGVVAADTVTVNVDDVRAQLPEYKAMIAAGKTNASAFTHEEANDVGKAALVGSLWLGYQLRFDFAIPEEAQRTFLLIFPWVISFKLFCLW